jgi:hypothetical protein
MNSKSTHSKKPNLVNPSLEKSLLFLNNSDTDWRSCLDHSLRFLRKAWQVHWVGLPFVVDACATFLKLRETEDHSISSKLLSCARQLAVQIEAESVAALGDKEPSYHNRLHFADVLTTITLQAAIESSHWKMPNAAWHAALILIALTHDLHHPGHVNKTPSEIEKLSFEALKPYLQENAIPSSWVKRIEHIIISSDFVLVAQNHKRIVGKTFTWCSDWALVLLNEADIIASTHNEFGPELGQALAKEWETTAFPAYRTVATAQGRVNFLSNIEFSSYSAKVLGMSDELRKQLA